MKLMLPVIALVAFVCVYANQQKVTISGGFFTGKDYLEMTEGERRAYATGSINGMLVAPFFGAAPESVNWVKTCTGKMSDEQIAGILTRYIREQPGQMETNLNVVTFNAIKSSCK
jgi:hypothetical protein